VITTVDNHIRSYENVITYMNVGTCRYQCTTIPKYPVPELDALWKLKDGTLRNIQFRTARTQTTPQWAGDAPPPQAVSTRRAATHRQMTITESPHATEV
jgi:hypothetical protein